jgi:hypothetical protein
MIYLVLSSLCLALLYGVYRLALSRTTLHRFNRIMLLCILGLSAILPAIKIDAFDDSPLLHVLDYEEEEIIVCAKGDSPQLHQLQAEYNEEAILEYVPIKEKPAQSVKTSVAAGVKMVETVTRMDWVSIITYLYLLGVAFFMIRLLIGVTRAETLCRLGGRRLNDGSHLLVCDGDFQPTSWRHTVIISRKDYESESSDMIIEHEQAHIRCRHSIDVVLAQTVCALQWFNPAAWALKRSLQEIHEYEADAAVLADGENERRYQICLVQAALGGRIGFVTSNFADCSTKKRIKMMKRNQSSPFACLRALLLLPVVAVIILTASACKQDAKNNGVAQAGTNEPGLDQTAPEKVKSEPYDTLALLKKFGYNSDVETDPYDIKIKKLNHYVTIETDGSIWFNIAGQNNYERAYLSSLDRDFEIAKSKSNIEVTNPEKVYVMYNRDNHLDICAEVIRQLQKSYSDEDIVFAREPLLKTVPPPPGLTLDIEKDDYISVMINSNNEIRLEGKWSPGEGIKASFNSQDNISPQEISKLDDLIRAAIPEINEKTPPESTIVKGLKGYLQWDLTCSHRVVSEVEKIILKYVDRSLYLYQKPVNVVEILQPK